MSSRSRTGEHTDPCTLLLAGSDQEQGSGHGACLVVIRGERLGARVDLEAGPVVIGRGSDADFRIDSRSVSRSHCRIVRREHRYWVEDLRSTNHTFINEAQIEQAALADGDQLRVGQSVLKFLDAGNLELGYLAEMREHAVRDPLTGLYNRRHIMALLADEVAGCRSNGQRRLAVAIIDVDHFKEINDLIGHLAGDSVLRQMAAVLGQRLRAGDTLGRIGGEEFAVVMPDAPANGAMEACERLCAAVAEERFHLEDGRELAVTVSIGLACWDGSAMADLSDLLRRADAALYAAKDAGRNRIQGPVDGLDPGA